MTPIIRGSWRTLGKAGVAVDSILDMEHPLRPVFPLDQMSVSMTMNGAVLPMHGLSIS